MAFRSISATRTVDGDILVQFQCTLDNATEVRVDYGPDTTYGFPATGGTKVGGPDADGYVSYQVSFGTSFKTFHYACTVTAGRDGSETSDDQTYRETGSEPAAKVNITADEQQIDVGASTTVYVTVTDAAGNPTQGRTVKFSYKTGTTKGTFSPAQKDTDASGGVECSFTIQEAGQSHIQAACDSVLVGMKIKGKN